MYVCNFTDVPAIVPNVTVDTMRIDGDKANLTLCWDEPFDNLDPITNYNVSCIPNTITNNTTRSYNITDLDTNTNYSFTVAAINRVGIGEASVLTIITPSELTICMSILCIVYVVLHVCTYVQYNLHTMCVMLRFLLLDGLKI